MATLVLGLLGQPLAATSQIGPESSGGLELLLEPGALLEDRNGDGVIDFVAGSLLLGEPATDSDVAAAADVAARLGFESAAMDLPLARSAGVNEPSPPGSSDGLTFIIGAAGLSRAGIAEQIDLDGLGGGVGIVELLEMASGPALLIAGGDEAGTRAAAAALAGRFPHIWDPEGPTLADLVGAARRLFEEEGIGVTAAGVCRFLVNSGSDGLERVDLHVRVPAASIDRAELVVRRSVAQPSAQPNAAEGGPSGNQIGAGLIVSGLGTLRVVLSAPGIETRVIDVPGAELEPRDQVIGRRSASAKENLDLSNLYTNDGFFGDSDDNLIPDRVDVLLSSAGDGLAATADLAARLGLESTGITVPVAVAPEDVDEPAGLPTLVLIGRSHPLVEQLAESRKLQLADLEPGQGLIQVVPKAFEDNSAVVVVGADESGLNRAMHQLAERFPHVWERGKDRPTLKQVKHDLWMMLSSRSPAGQAATALYKLDRILEKLGDIDLEYAEVDVHVEKADQRLGGFVRQYLEGKLVADDLEVVIDNLDVQQGQLLIDEEFEVPSEVDDFWDVFRTDLLPRLQRGQTVTLEALLSEPPEVRARIAQRALDELLGAGAEPSNTSVTILSAYKQGYSWLYDVVRPTLEGKSVHSLKIRFAEIGPPEEWPQQAMYTPTRWLLELFPIDEVLARDLGLDLEQVEFEMMPPGSPAYEVVATGPDGAEIYRATFEPKYVLRPYFDRFADYERARVTTGWVTAHADGETIVDRRVVTDLERFWDHFQSHTLMEIYDYVMEIGEGKPRAGDAPHFGELRVDVSLSEPDYQVGIDKEQVASMEALHEEIYFGTLHFFDVLGRLARGMPLNYPGRVIPIVRPKNDGMPGRAHITFTGFGSSRPAVTVKYRERGGRDRLERMDIPEVNLDKPEPLAALVRDGQAGIEKLAFHVKVDFEQDRRAEFIRRTRAEFVDRNISSAEQITAAIDNLAKLRDAGLYQSALAYADFGEIELAAGWEHQINPEAQIVARLPANGTPEPAPEIEAVLPPDYRWNGAPIVQWDTPIPPSEAYEILAKMSTFPEATVYKVGESYLGKEIWAMDLMSPVEVSHWSQAKATTLKPTVIYSARQHANEVSSTSHVLKLGELLLTDPDYSDSLEKVNVVIHPIANPDGAQLAYDLYEITPDYMLHAGYLGSLGVDVTSGADSDDPIYPEAKVRPLLWRTWLPDIFLNPHGYPSHEWVQLFSEYAGWVRNRATESRGWWGMRGWFMPSFRYLDDPEYPDHKAAAFEIRDRITERINAIPEVQALNNRAYDRYRRYAFAWDPSNFKLDFTDDVLIYMPIKGASGSGGGPMSNPRVTIWSGTTEAPDETAHGDWLKLVAAAGLEWDKALLEYLLEGNHQIERTRTASSGAISLKINRKRPATAEEAAPEERSSTEPRSEGRR